ncbi:MAG: type II toxin-antitoxin system HicB family antitoxin [Acidimicrobiaceae bacterium]|nr:type II toxin-antitoxin system HicB family antitoxin [Acidimicrobiaceae bacterium]
MVTDLGELQSKREAADKLRANSGYSAGMGQPAAQLPLECWLDAALAGASTEEVRDDDGVLVGWWAENPECKGASAFGATPDEARSKLRQVLVGWVELGRQLGHPIPSFHNGIVAAPV